jgi:hypothetical protein
VVPQHRVVRDRCGRHPDRHPARPDDSRDAAKGRDPPRRRRSHPQAWGLSRFGLGLLLASGLAHITDLEGFAAGAERLVLASESEPAARSQYVVSLHTLVGEAATSRLLAREVSDFPGRLGIQHRDVPYALLNKLADGGITFSHLAQFYALSFPHALRAIPVPAAAAFGSGIALARAAGEASPIADAFARFFLAAASTAYPEGGFSPVRDFAYGSVIDLTAR